MTRRRWIADTTSGTTASLLNDQAAHLARVLRAQPGQVFDVVANGFLHRAEVLTVSESEVTFQLHEELESDAALPVHLFLAVFKFDHLEWGIEKATELGVARITPVLARRTEKHLALAAPKRVDRWRRIALESSKQSRRTDVPDIDDPLPLKQALPLATAPTRLLLAETEQQNTLTAALQSLTRDNGPDAERNHALCLAVGPKAAGPPKKSSSSLTPPGAPVTLGPRILRAETAAIAALSICSAFL